MTNPVEIPLKVQGMVASFDRSHLPLVQNLFVARDVVQNRIYGGLRNGNFETTVVDRSIIQTMGNYCFVGLGAIKFLSQNNPFVKFKFIEVNPKRDKKVLDEFEVTETLKNHPRFLLNGKPRDYFYESLEECRKHPLGTIKLPTQSGKTSILLTLAHNLRRQVGNGVIFVSSANLRKQLLRRAEEEYGIPNVIDYESYSTGKVNRKVIDKTQSWIIVMTPQLFNSRVKAKTLDGSIYKWMIYDECHHICSATGQSIFYYMQNLTRAYGFSASTTEKEIPVGSLTFNKIDYKDALRISSFGTSLYSRRTSDMIEEGNNNKTVLINFIYRWDPEEFSALQFQFDTMIKGGFNSSDYAHNLEMLCMNKSRMKCISEIQSILNESGRNSMLNVARRKYGFSMLEMLQRNDTALWYGSDTVYENSQLMVKVKDFDATEYNPWKETSHEKFDNIYKSKLLNTKTMNSYFGTTIRNLIATSTVGSEGVSFDIPINSCILSEGKGSNTIMVLQRAGRTGAKGDKVSIIINMLDKDAPVVLRKHASSRMTTLSKEYKVKPVYIDGLTELRNYINKIDNGEIKI